jgi:predicted RNA binding protein YcfA (HicA-like mRNA interferase family)
MKYSELLRIIKKAGWKVVRQNGTSHVIYSKEEFEDVSVPYHGSEEIGIGLANKIMKVMKLK